MWFFFFFFNIYNLGSCRIIGAVIIVIGLYFVLWGKRVDQPASTGTAAPNEEQMATFTENMGTSNRVFVDVSSVVPTDEHL
jgi:drug/metabolite transporter (DMT)-like permease